MMRALTLWQPWAWAIVAGHKPVENRTWAPRQNMVGIPFAIHAGKRWDDGGAFTVLSLLGLGGVPDDPAANARGAIVGIAKVTRVVRLAQDDIELYIDDPGSVGSEALLTDDQRRWFFGPYGWVLGDVRRLAEPVPCRGFQMFWTLPRDVEAAVLRQLEDEETRDFVHTQVTDPDAFASEMRGALLAEEEDGSTGFCRIPTGGIKA